MDNRGGNYETFIENMDVLFAIFSVFLPMYRPP